MKLIFKWEFVQKKRTWYCFLSSIMVGCFFSLFPTLSLQPSVALMFLMDLILIYSWESQNRFQVIGWKLSFVCQVLCSEVVIVFDYLPCAALSSQQTARNLSGREEKWPRQVCLSPGCCGSLSHRVAWLSLRSWLPQVTGDSPGGLGIFPIIFRGWSLSAGKSNPVIK